MLVVVSCPLCVRKLHIYPETVYFPSCQAITTKTLFEWDTPVSPHLAALKESKMVTDPQILNAIRTEFHGNSPNGAATFTIVETAGGPLSPGKTCVRAYRHTACITRACAM